MQNSAVSTDGSIWLYSFSLYTYDYFGVFRKMKYGQKSNFYMIHYFLIVLDLIFHNHRSQTFRDSSLIRFAYPNG